MNCVRDHRGQIRPPRSGVTQHNLLLSRDDRYHGPPNGRTRPHAGTSQDHVRRRNIGAHVSSRESKQSHGNDGVDTPASLALIATPITFAGHANAMTRSVTTSVFRIAQHRPQKWLRILNFGAIVLTRSISPYISTPPQPPRPASDPTSTVRLASRWPGGSSCSSPGDGSSLTERGRLHLHVSPVSDRGHRRRDPETGP